LRPVEEAISDMSGREPDLPALRLELAGIAAATTELQQRAHAVLERLGRIRRIVAAVASVIADELDRTRQISETARIVRAAAAGVVLTRDGDTLPLPGLPDHRLLTRGSSILTTAARELADIRAHISFLAPLPGSGREPLVRVTAFDCAVPDLDHLSAAVLLSPPGTCAAWGRWTCWFSGSWSTGRRRSRPSLPHWAWTRPG
jgi:hypothetical protein